MSLPSNPTPSILTILSFKRFSGLFYTQFLTSFNDNFFKNSIIALLNFGAISENMTPDERKIWIILAGLCFILPYFIFSATAGKLAEKYNRINIVYILKYSEIFILGLGGIGLMLHNIPLMMAMLFLMGMQSTFFSPIKFGILPTYLHRNALVGGNALIETATFVAIILGTIVGTQLVLMQPFGEIYSLILMLFFAVMGIITAYKMPHVSKITPEMVMDCNIISHNIEVFKIMYNAPKIFRYINSGAWFWFVAAVLMTILPIYVTDVLYMNKDVYTLLLVLFSVGVGAGSVLCAKVLDGNITAKYTPVAALIMGVFSIDLGAVSVPIMGVDMLSPLSDFISHGLSWRIMFDFLMLSLAGGMYIVPFFALVQDEAVPKEKSRMIAGNNIINAFAMVLGGLYMLGITKLGVSLQMVFLLTGVFCVLGCIIVHFMIEDSVLKLKSKG